MRIGYRVRQFWHTLRDKPAADELTLAQRVLDPALMALFERQHPGEQSHSLRLCRQLMNEGENDLDLLTAALLHDVGKSRHPLRIWERVVIVVCRAILPRQVKVWGQGAARGWRRAFVVAEQHPAWGAEMAGQAGASQMTCAIIRRHQESIAQPADTLEDQLLQRLQIYDDEN